MLGSRTSVKPSREVEAMATVWNGLSGVAVWKMCFSTEPVSYHRLEEASVSRDATTGRPKVRWTLLQSKSSNIDTHMVYFSVRFSPHQKRDKSTNKLGSGSRHRTSVSRTTHWRPTRQIKPVTSTTVNLCQAVTLCQRLWQMFYNHFLIYSSPHSERRIKMDKDVLLWIYVITETGNYGVPSSNLGSRTSPHSKEPSPTHRARDPVPKAPHASLLQRILPQEWMGVVKRCLKTQNPWGQPSLNCFHIWTHDQWTSSLPLLCGLAWSAALPNFERLS